MDKKINILELDTIAQDKYGVNYNALGLFAKWDVEDHYYKHNKCKYCNNTGFIQVGKYKKEICKKC